MDRGEWNRVVEPFFAKQRVKFAVAQVIGEVKEKPARGGRVEKFPQKSGHLAVFQLGRRQW